MSSRLNVVISQSAGDAPGAQEMESDLVMRLISTSGVHLTLVGPLGRLDASSTDALAMESIPGDIVLLGWLDPSEASERLRAAAIQGHRAPHSLDPDAPRPGGRPHRRLYLTNLRGKTVDQVTAALERLRAAQQTVTFSLGPPPSTTSSPAADDSRGSTGSRAPDGPSTAAIGSGPSGAGPSDATAVDARSGAPEDADPGKTPHGPDPWDSLVDDLNASGI